MRPLRAIILAAVAAAIAMPTVAAQAADFPTKDVTIVVPFGPGGGNDTVARYMADHLAKAWGQPVVVENKPGAGTAIGTASVARAKPDGYTLLFVSSTLTTNAAASANLPYDAIKDLAPIAMTGKVPQGLVTGPKMPVKTVAELIETAKSREVLYGTSGPGTINHFTAELFNNVAGIKARPVHYKGGNEALTALMGGEIDFFISSYLQLEPFVSSGQVAGLMLTGDEKVPSTPDVPTAPEAGMTGTEVEIWWGMFAPAATPPDVVAKINADLNAILQLPETAEFLAKNGAKVTVTTPAEFTQAVHDELAKWQKIAATTDLGLEGK